MRTCPGCAKGLLPPFKGGNAVVCQNGDCRGVYNAEGDLIGRWSHDWSAFEPLTGEKAA